MRARGFRLSGREFRFTVWGFGFRVSGLYLNLPKPTFLFIVPINSILGCIIRTYKKVGFGSSR